MFHLFLLIQIIVLVLELVLQFTRQILTQNPIYHLRIIQSFIFYQFSLNLLNLSVSNSCVSSTLSNSSDAMVQKPSFDSYSFKSSSPFKSTTSKSSISFSPTNRNNFSVSVPSVIKSNDSKSACAPPQTSHLLPFPIKSSRHLFSLLLKPANQFFLKIRRCLILPPYFKFLNYRSYECNSNIAFYYNPIKIFSNLYLFANLLFSFISLTCSSCFILNFNILEDFNMFGRFIEIK